MPLVVAGKDQGVREACQDGPWASSCLERGADQARLVTLGHSVLTGSGSRPPESLCLTPVSSCLGLTIARSSQLRQPSGFGREFPRMPPAKLSGTDLWPCHCRPCLLPVLGTLRMRRLPSLLLPSPIPASPSPCSSCSAFGCWLPVFLPSCPANLFCCQLLPSARCHTPDVGLLRAPAPSLTSSWVESSQHFSPLMLC